MGGGFSRPREPTWEGETVACFANAEGKTPAMIEYVKVLRIDHWLKNVFIFFGHLVALALLPDRSAPEHW